MSHEFTDRLQAALGSAYAIERELGGGGMSRVYLARETALGRDVVLKVLPPELTSSVNLDRFRREVQYAAQLQHPHIVPLLNAGESDELLWYTMPLITGESLRAVLDRRGALPAGEVLQILHDVADGLGAAHRLGLVHRDIKPENILLQGEHALITDFGVAKAITASLPGTAATAVGVAVGTPAYMAPEQVAGDPSGDHRIDLYALGLLAYELLTGAAPFGGASPHQTMAAHLTRQPTPPDAMRANLPPGLSTLVMRCLQKDPDHRYPDAAALIADLRRISAGEGRRIAPVPGAAPTDKPVRRPGSLALGTLLVALAIVGGYALAGLLRDEAPAAPAPDSATVAAPPAAAATLTFADSLAIADAVERELAVQTAATQVVTAAMLDSIRREITATLTDSVRRANRGAPGPRDGPPDDPARLEAIQRAEERMREMGTLLEFAGRASGEAAVGMGRGGPARVLVLPTAPSQGTGWFAGNPQQLTARVGSALMETGRLQVVPVSSRVDSLLALGMPAEAVARLSSARFYVTMQPLRQRDSVGANVTIHDLAAGSRQLRTLRVMVAQPNDRSITPLTGEIANQVAAALAAMQSATFQRPPRPPRPETTRRDSTGLP